MGRSIAVIAPSSVPFQIGGAEKFWWGLHRALSELPDHFVELIKLPAPEGNFEQLVNSYRQFSELDLSHFDMVISSKYPGWMVRHCNHVVYMLHPLRGLYDTYALTGQPLELKNVPPALASLVELLRKPNPAREDLPTVFDLCQRALANRALPSKIFNFPGPLIRMVVRFLDRVALAPDQITAYLAISRTVSKRQDYFPPGANVKVLPPPSDIRKFLTSNGEYIFTASRLHSLKRIGMIIEAMRHVHGDIALKIAGTGPEEENLRRLAASDPRIEFLGHVPDSDLPRFYSHALFVPFVPYDEDYGLITVEAMMSGKAVITTSDAGGVCEFVENGKTGLCVEPTPEALGRAMQRLVDDRELAVSLGRTAKEHVREISWPNVVDALLRHAASAQTRRNDAGRPRIVVCSTFTADRFGNGGQRRLFHFCAALAEKFDVQIVCPGIGAAASSRNLAAGIRELHLPKPVQWAALAGKIMSETGISADDVAALLTCRDDAALQASLGALLPGACAAIACHPWFFPLLERVAGNIPFIYDAQDVEVDVKAPLYAKTHPEIMAAVHEAEAACCKNAAAVFCCSDENRNRLQELYGISVDICHIAANGYDSDEVTFHAPTDRKKLRSLLAYPEAKLALFMGSDHAPNICAAHRIEEIASGMADVQFLIAGSVCDALVREKRELPPNMHLVGRVSETVKNILLHAADVGLNPVETGSGTNLKIIEYVASGLECVTTPFGARGMGEDFSPLAHVCPLEDFPGQIGKVLQHRAMVSSRDSQLIEERFSWRASMGEVCGIVESCVEAAESLP